MGEYFFGYRCPECGGKFKWNRNEEPPERCPLCQAWVSEDEPAEFAPKAPAIHKSPYVKAVDLIYRETERQSIDRANEAASLLEDEYRRQPNDEHSALTAEFQKSQLDDMRSGLKITNMREPTEMREGDTAAIMPKTSPNSPVVQGAGFQTYNGAVSGGGGSGDMANFVKSFTADHTPRAVGMIRAGNMGRYRG